MKYIRAITIDSLEGGLSHYYSSNAIISPHQQFVQIGIKMGQVVYPVLSYARDLIQKEYKMYEAVAKRNWVIPHSAVILVVDSKYEEQQNTKYRVFIEFKTPINGFIGFFTSDLHAIMDEKI